MALGVLYQETGRPSYEQLVREGDEPLYTRKLDKEKLASLINTYH
jgi:hypothetical protein